MNIKRFLFAALCCVVSQAVLAQAKRISGTVTDAEGPVMMANVVEVDANNRIVSGGKYSTMLADEVGVTYVNQISGGEGKLQVKDAHGTVHVIDANQGGRYSNVMTRDYWLDGEKTSRAKTITTSSFCVIHEISEAMNWNAADRYDSQKSRAQAVKVYKRLKAKNQL